MSTQEMPSQSFDAILKKSKNSSPPTDALSNRQANFKFCKKSQSSHRKQAQKLRKNGDQEYQPNSHVRMAVRKNKTISKRHKKSNSGKKHETEDLFQNSKQLSSPVGLRRRPSRRQIKQDICFQNSNQLKMEKLQESLQKMSHTLLQQSKNLDYLRKLTQKQGQILSQLNKKKMLQSSVSNPICLLPKMKLFQTASDIHSIRFEPQPGCYEENLNPESSGAKPDPIERSQSGKATYQSQIKVDNEFLIQQIGIPHKAQLHEQIGIPNCRISQEWERKKQKEKEEDFFQIHNIEIFEKFDDLEISPVLHENFLFTSQSEALSDQQHQAYNHYL